MFWTVGSSTESEIIGLAVYKLILPLSAHYSSILGVEGCCILVRPNPSSNIKGHLDSPNMNDTKHTAYSNALG